ncbi:MAG: hypothetical protein QNK37_17815 [Acidobacteriota bacterium]|nr:hypothetical protein [Acidobacteriota bacterium]
MKKMIFTLLISALAVGFFSTAGESCTAQVDCPNGSVSCSVAIDPGTVSCTSTANSVTCNAYAPDGTLVSSRTSECGAGLAGICERFPFLSICQ